MRRPIRVIVFGATALVLASLVGQAWGQGRACGNRDAMIAALASDRWGETLERRGIVADGSAMVEITSNPGTGTWTILRTDAGGQTCIMDTGRGWEGLDEPSVPPGEPS